MDSFFGIGVFELVFIFIFALIFLGPERLPEVMRQVLSFIRQVRALSSDITKQINDEFGDLGELDPRRQVQQIMNDATTPVKNELKSTAKSAATPKANPNATPKKPVATQPKTTPAKTPSVAKPVAKTTEASTVASGVAAESAAKTDGDGATSAAAPTTESAVAAVPQPEDRPLNGDLSHHERALNPEGDGARVAAADNTDNGHTIAPPSLPQAKSAPATEGAAEQERVMQRTAEEGSA